VRPVPAQIAEVEAALEGDFAFELDGRDVHTVTYDPKLDDSRTRREREAHRR